MTIRVALLNGNWYPQTGGGIVHVDELGRRLVQEHGCDVTVITKQTLDTGADFELPEGMNLKQVQGTDSSKRIWNELRYFIGILSQVKSNEYDIVHGHTNTTAFPLQLIGAVSDAKSILTVHGANLDLSVTFAGSRLDIAYSYARRLILKHFRYDAVVSVSDELREVLSEFHPVVRFIPNGVNVNDFPMPSGYGEKQILFVGRLRPKKNASDAVRAMAIVREEHPEAVLHIVGEGPMREDIEATIERVGLRENVVMHGYVDDEALYELYGRCSMFVLPSEWEGHPLVLLEAWASGMVVVGTNVEGIREFMDDRFGELVPLNDSKALGQTLSQLLEDSRNTEERGVVAREFVQCEYSWESTVERTYELYRDLAYQKTPDR